MIIKQQEVVMMGILTMGTTLRHMEILDWFSEYSNQKKEEDPTIKTGREQIALVENKGELIDLSKYTELGIQRIKETMGVMKHTYPDFMIFKDNLVLINEKRTRYAGIPDLIVEVWSETNPESDRERKRELYRTNKSELWEINQDSAVIICWSKDGKMYEQHMDKSVKTPWGEELDLTNLARDVIDVLPNDRFNGGPDDGKDIDLSKFEK